MTTHNYMANSSYVAAYQAEVTADLRNARMSRGRLEAIRRRIRLRIERSMDLRAKGNGLEADTHQIRNFDQSTEPGACEVNLGARLAT